MKQLLDTIGAVLYLILSIVLMPVFILTRIFIQSVTTYRQVKLYSRQLRKLWLHRKPVPVPFPFHFEWHPRAELVRIFSRIVSR